MELLRSHFKRESGVHGSVGDSKESGLEKGE